MSSYGKSASAVGSKIQSPVRFSDTWITLALAAFGVLIALSFIYAYRSLTTWDYVDETATSDQTPIPRWIVTPASASIPKS
jgi:hypothetical protein